MKPVKKNDDWMKLCGAWKDWDLSTAAIIRLIGESRVSTRVI